jgi:penicillin amidase
VVHLSTPGLDVIGAGEPALPGVSIGHNGVIAFGLTIFGADQEDVYVYETADGDLDAYRYGNGWERMQVMEERFTVRGAPEQIMTLKFTRHGPVIFEDSARRLAYAVRTVWLEPGAAAYFASISGMRARNFEEFRHAMRRWGAPSVNQVYADTSGRIAWLPVGYTPIRPNWDGLLPVPGDGRYEWAGFLDPDALPRVVDPPQGFVATANEMNLPADWDHHNAAVGFEWAEASRATRIHEVLSTERPHSAATSCALQTDDHSIPARRVLCVLSAVSGQGASDALDLLRGWDTRLAADSAPAALFEVWWTRHLKPALFALAVADEGVRKLMAPGDVETLLRLIESPDDRLGTDPIGARDHLLIETLNAAFRDCAGRMGEHPRFWRWGQLHQGYFEHPLSALAPVSDRRLDIGPFPKGGSASTPMHAGYRPSDFRIIAGASVRMVLDVGDWDRSQCINAPGQSGDPRSVHYADLAPIWAAGEYVPLLYGRDAIDKAAGSRIELLPAKP